MKRGILLTIVVASVISSAVTTLMLLAVLPEATYAQAARTTAVGLTVVNSDGLQGVTADVRPTGGGVLQILGADGKTIRAQLAAAGGGAAGQPPNPANAGLDIRDVDGNPIARVGNGLNIPGAGVGVQLLDANGNVRYLASLDSDGNPTIQLFDAGGNVVWSAP
jgi:hypothetical protein